MVARGTIAAVAGAFLACGFSHPRAPVAFSRPGPEAGVRTFLVDDMRFVAPDWPSRIEGISFVVEEDGPCRKKKFLGPPSVWHRGGYWEPATTCTFIEIIHRRDSFESPRICEDEIASDLRLHVFRRFSEASRASVSLAGRPATQDDLLYGAGTEAMRFVSYQVCWGKDLYLFLVGGLDSAWDDVERLRARMIASLRWVDPAEAAAAGAAAIPTAPGASR